MIDAVVPARARFAITTLFHLTSSVGLARYLAMLGALLLWTKRRVFVNLFEYRLKIIAIAFNLLVGFSPFQLSN